MNDLPMIMSFQYYHEITGKSRDDWDEWRMVAMYKLIHEMQEEKEPRMPRMVGIRQAAEESGCSYSLVLQLCKSGRICHVQCGEKYLVNMDKLIEYFNSVNGKGIA